MNTSPSFERSTPQTLLSEHEATGLYRRVGLRVLLLMALTYLMDSLDRLNIGYAQHQISERIHLSLQDYGFIAGIFFAGYVLFEIPAIWLMERTGARRTFARITFLWGLTSASMCFVHTAFEFSVLRFLLGVFEAGFAPACLFYFSLWYPEKRMARVVSLEQSMGPFAGIIAGPLSGFILDKMDYAGGIDGWRWMFFLEGLPSIALAVIIYMTLPESPQEEKWLTNNEKQYLIRHASGNHYISHNGFKDVLTDRRVWFLGLSFLSVISGIYTIGFWLPHIIRQTGVSANLTIGLLSAIPYIFAVPFMLFWSARADKCRRRIPCVLYPLTLSSLTFLAFGFAGSTNTIFAISLITLSTITLYAAYTVFLAIPSDILKGKGAATGYAIINMMGLMGGFLSPYLISLTEHLTGSIYYGLMQTGVLMCLGALLLYAGNIENTKNT